VWAGIPLSKLNKSESERLLSLDEELHKRVVGQDTAVKAVSDAIRWGRAGLRDIKRPTGSFIFAGPSGVGKTELAKALSESLFGDERSLIRLDMSEYMEKHSVSRLIGSPPGYVGFEEGGQLTEKVRRKPYSVILFDEIEKAHPNVSNILLQILEDGILTDSKGRQVSFSNTVIIFTSNLGAREITEEKPLGFSSEDSVRSPAALRHSVTAEIKKFFRPELLNRIDEIIVFDKLNSTEMTVLARKMLSSLGQRATDAEISLEFTDEAVAALAEEALSDKDDSGARALRRIITERVENPLSRMIIGNDISAGANVRLISDNSGISLSVEKARLTVGG